MNSILKAFLTTWVKLPFCGYSMRNIYSSINSERNFPFPMEFLFGSFKSCITQLIKHNVIRTQSHRRNHECCFRLHLFAVIDCKLPLFSLDRVWYRLPRNWKIRKILPGNHTFALLNVHKNTERNFANLKSLIFIHVSLIALST